ncbi:immunoglobulin-like domain-containing protein [Rhizobium sp. R693]|uniref:immunoglobulin-like domain-containing protein n=1 Tax=Rhizobium sp. R693 TaxID=1764276 RepID=UPI000B53815F|nr:immunoglobulin-like domain-containing protein [Rhizobium sp. R693]OWV96968.1 hypothetical protein ATY79_23320 [Rhizobium sp. R693]
MSIEDPRISAIASENVSHDFRQDIHEDASIETSARQGVEVAQADNSQQPEKTDRVPAAPQIVAANGNAVEVVPDQHNVAHLPADVSIDDIRVEGNNLVLVQADGTEIVIVNGALHVPTFLLGEVELPQQAVIAALEQNNINVAAGPDGSYSASASAPSSGGNFDTIQQPPHLPPLIADLLPPTDQPDGQPGGLFGGRDSGSGNLLAANPPSVDTPTPDNGVTIGDLDSAATGSDAVVWEAGLPGGSAEGLSANPTVVDGKFTISAPDGLASVTIGTTTINGADLLNAATFPISVTPAGSSLGTLVLTGYNAATHEVSYKFTLANNATHGDTAHTGVDDQVSVNYGITVTDTDGDSANGTLTIAINDDGPTAANDEDAVSGPSATGNVISGADESVTAGLDTKGADGASVTNVAFGNETGTSVTDAYGHGHQVTGTYGTLTIYEDGHYSYIRTNDSPVADTVSDTFTYTLTDGDGDSDTATLKINITDNGVTIGDLDSAATGSDAVVWEAGLPGGSAEGLSANPTVVDGKFTISAPDGLASVTIGTTTINGADLLNAATFPISVTPAGSSLGTLVLTGYNAATHEVSYKFTLANNATHGDTAHTGVDDQVSANYGITVTDTDGDSANGTLTIAINDDGPTANDDTDSFDTDTFSTDGNVITGADTTSGTAGKDVTGADGAHVSEVSFGNATVTNVTDGTHGAGFEVHGAHGTLTLFADGHYIYAQDPADHTGGTDTFTYTLTDGDGDTDTATLTITVPHQNTPLEITGSATGVVEEEELSGGNPDLLSLSGNDDATLSNAVQGVLTSALSISGKDGPLSFAIGAVADSVAVTTVSGGGSTPLTSGGLTVYFHHSDDGTLVGYTNDTGSSGYSASSTTIFTLVITDQTTGAYTFTLQGPIDHPVHGSTPTTGEDSLVIDLGGLVTVSDTGEAGDHASVADFRITVIDDVPVVSARDAIVMSHTSTDTTTNDYSLRAGNVLVRGVGQGGHDLLLTTADGHSVNTNNGEVGVDNAWINGASKKADAQYVLVQFGHDLDLNTNTFVGGRETYSEASFTVDVSGGSKSTAAVFVNATHGGPGGSLVGLTFEVNGHSVNATVVANGYVLTGVHDGDVVTVHSATTGAVFDTIEVANYANVDDGANSFSGDQFRISGVETAVTTVTVTTTTEAFTLSQDETAGVNTAADPNASNDHAAPAAGTDAYSAIYKDGAIGYAESESVLKPNGGLFTGSVGADHNASGGGTWTFAITDASGHAFNGTQDSGLTTLDHTHIMLTTGADGALVGSANGTEVFKVYVDTDGHVWIAQYQAIHNGAGGSNQAAYDKIATVTAGLHITGTLTDADGDQASATSPVSLTVQFQDDGPIAHDTVGQVAEGSVVTGTLDFVQGTDGATVSQINGVNLTFGNDGWSQAIQTAQGTLQIKADGTYQFTAHGDNVYKDAGSASFTFTVKDGDGDTSTANVSFNVADTQTNEPVTLTASSVTEGTNTNYTFTATLADQVHDTPVTVTIVDGNGQSHDITIAVGQTTGSVSIASGNGEDVYKDASSLTAHITGVTGGNFENPVYSSANVIATVSDTTDTTTVTLHDVTVTEAQQIVYTASVDHAPQTAFDVTLNNNVVIHFAAGATTGSSDPQAAQGEDVFKDGSTSTLSIASTTGGNYENLDTSSTAKLTVSDTTDTVTATLTADEAILSGAGATITYTVTLSNADGLPVAPTTNLTFTLQTGQTVTILAGASSGHADVTFGSGTGTSVHNSIAGITGGGEYEYLVPDGTTDTTVNTFPTGGGNVSLTLSEAALDTTLDNSTVPADLAASAVTGTAPGSRGETAQATSGINFTATGEALTVAFATPGVSASGWQAPTVNGLANGYSVHWELSSGQLVGHLISPTSVDLGAFVLLSLAGTTAAAGQTLTPTVTATLVDNLIDGNNVGSLTISGIQVVATDTTGDKVSGSVALTITDDAPSFGAPDTATVADKAVDAAHATTGSLHLSVGADGLGSLSLAGNTAPSGLTLDGKHPVSYAISGDGLTLTAWADLQDGGTTQDVKVFTLMLNASTGTYTFDLLTPFTTQHSVDSSSTAFGSGPSVEQALWSGTTPIAVVSASGSLMGSSNGWGVDNGNFDANEKLTFDFTSGAAHSPAAVSGFGATPPVFADFTFTKSGSLTYTIHYVDGSSGDPETVDVTKNTPLHLGALGHQIAYISFTANGSLGMVDLTGVTSISGTSENLAFNVTATDGDGDQATAHINVHIDSTMADPIVLDLDHNGVALTSLDQGVQFDINADGHKDQIAWTAGSDGILALDVDGNGKIDNGSEIFSPHFAGGTYVDGLAALSTLDSNHDGKIDATDEVFSKLTVWQDLNHNGITDSGELSSLADHSISSISLDASASNAEINGQSILADGDYTLTDGATGHFVEVAFDTSLGGSENSSNAYSLIGSDGDDILSGSGGMFTISGGAGADTFVLDADALNDVKLADVITDFKASEGDTLDVSKLLDSLLGHQASEAEALASVKTTVTGADTVVSVNASGGWHDVAVLQNTTEAVKILYDDKHDTTTAPHVG